MNDTDELKISEMEEAEEVNNEDLIMIVQDGRNKKTKAKNVGVGGEATGDTLPIGATIEWYSDIIPENWLLCDGQAVSRIDYSELFNVLGIRYGQGDGNTTFNLPDLRGKGTIGKDENDNDFNELGKIGGEKEHTLTVAKMPEHSHVLTLKYGSGNAKWGLDGDWSAGTENTEQIKNTGKNQAHNNLQPFLTCNFIIKAKQTAGLVATVVDNLNSTSETDALSAKQGNLLKKEVEKVRARKMQITELYGNGDIEISNNTEKKINLTDDWTKYDMCIVITRGDYNHYDSIIFIKGYNRAYNIHIGTEQSGYYATGYAVFDTNTSITVKCENARGWGALVLSKVLGINFNAKESEE